MLLQFDVSHTASTATDAVRSYATPVDGSATRTGAPLLETPRAASTIARDRIDGRTVRSVSGAPRPTPGVPGEGLAQDSRINGASIRGFHGRPGRDPDGARHSRRFGSFPIERSGLERIEVLRGPSPVLCGQTAPGGPIDLVSRRLAATPFGELAHRW